MAEATNTIAGSQEKAKSDGTAVRKETRGGRKTFLIGAIGAIVFAATIYFGYKVFGTDNDDPVATVRTTVTVNPTPTFTNGEITAPVHGWSDWTNVLDVECIYWQGTNPVGKRFKVEYVNPWGRIKPYDGTPLKEMRGVRFRSLTGSPEKINFRIVTKQNGAC